MNLYELTNQYKRLLELARESSTDEEYQLFKDTLEALEGTLEDKADGYVRVIRNLEAEAEAYDKEIKRMQDRKKTISNNIKRLKETLLYAAMQQDGGRIDTGLFKISIRNNPASVDVLDESIIPGDFFKVPAPQLNKRELTNALKDGLVVPGAALKYTQSIMIR